MYKSILIILILFAVNSAFALKIDVKTRKNLNFRASSIESSVRDIESSEIIETDPNYEKLIIKAARDISALLPTPYLPSIISINLESIGTYTNANGFSETIPMSVFLSTELPGRNEIRICDHEIKNNPDAVRTIVSHEMGHMIIEWAWRSSGAVPPNQLFGWIWTKSIYEGVADYFSATVNNTTSIGGGSNLWYGRDILKFSTYEDAQKSNLQSLVANIKLGLSNDGLLQHKTYETFINNLELELNGAPLILDANAEGTWLAGQLWQLNTQYGKARVIDVLIKIALTGEKKSDIQDFLHEVKLLLAASSIPVVKDNQ